MWEWREQYGGTIIEQFKRLGAIAATTSDERFTLDEGYVRGGAEGLRRPLRARAGSTATTTWSTGTRAARSAISDLEVEEREVDRHAVPHRLPAGRRRRARSWSRRCGPETMLADTAVAVHPDDERYRDLVGKTAILPLVGRELPIIADDYVKTDFGTGCAEDHARPRPQRLRDRPPPRARGDQRHRRGRPHDRRRRRALRRPDGRRGAASGSSPTCEALGAIRGAGALHPHRPVLAPLGRAHRAADLAAVVHAHGRAGRAGDRRRSATAACAIHPESQSRRYLDWLENIRPWCISRQLWWGHQIPVWYRGDETYVGVDAARGRGLGARPRRAGHLVQLGAVAVRHARLARATRPSCAPSTRPTCSRPRATSCSCGSPAW